jgi:hypothetical protein
MDTKSEGYSNRTTQTTESDDDFSLVIGGPLFQIFRRAYLSGSTLELLRRRIIVFTIVSWLPLLVLSALEGHAWGDSVKLTFLKDIDTHARFLIALPLLIVAELVVHRRTKNIVRRFHDRRLIPADALAQFEKALVSAKRLRNSVLAELLLLLFVYGIGVFVIWRRWVEVDLSSWHGLGTDANLRPSIAGWWFGLVSLPFFQFLMLRWYYRLAIWARFLWQVSRLKLDLLATHPDHCAGLGFLATVSYAFVPLLLAQGVVLSGMMANRVLYTGAPLTQFKVDIIGLTLGAVFPVLAPLLVFSPQLERVKRKARREYGALAQRCVRDFDNKWLRGGAPADESPISVADISSIADLGGAYQLIVKMRWIPFTTVTVLELGLTTLAPLAPLTLTVIPLEELVDRFLKIVF